MKIIMLFAFFFVPFLSFSQSKDETAIRKLMDDQTIAWNKGDVDGFMQGYWKNDSLMFIGQNGVTYGWTNTINNYKKNYPNKDAMGKLTFTLIQVKKISKKYYHVIGKWFLKRTIGDVGGHFTLVFEKIDGKWVIISDHSS